MSFLRRLFGGAMIAAALAVDVLSAHANNAAPYSAEAFKAAQAAGGPILIEIHAEECPTCRAQNPILDKLTGDPKFKDLKVFRIDLGSMKPEVRAFGAPMQSILIVFKGPVETGHSVGDTEEASIAARLDRSLDKSLDETLASSTSGQDSAIALNASKVNARR